MFVGRFSENYYIYNMFNKVVLGLVLAVSSFAILLLDGLLQHSWDGYFAFTLHVLSVLWVFHAGAG